MKTNLRNLLPAILAAALALGVFSSAAQTPPEKKRIGVGPVQATKSLEEDTARKGKSLVMRRVMESMDGQLISALAQVRKFNVIGRSDLKHLLDEQGLSNSGIVDAATASSPGKVKGLDYLVIITVDNFLEQNEDAAFASGRRLAARRFQLSAQAKIYRPDTGELLEAPNIQVERREVLEKPDAVISDANRTDDMMPALAREMSEKVANRVVDVVFPAKVIDKEGKDVTINRGDGMRIGEGEIWSVFGPAKTITDPDSGEVIKAKGAFMGRVRITGVEPTYSKGEIVEDKGIIIGCVLSKPAEAPSSASTGSDPKLTPLPEPPPSKP